MYVVAWHSDNFLDKSSFHRDARALVLNTTDNPGLGENEAGNHVVFGVEIFNGIGHVEPFDPVLVYHDILDTLGAMDRGPELNLVVPICQKAISKAW